MFRVLGIPNCFGEKGAQIAHCSSEIPLTKLPSQNSVTSLYKWQSWFITIVWGNNLMGQTLSVVISDAISNNCILKVDVKPSLFSRKKGSKSLPFNSTQIQVLWNLSHAKFGSGPEPLQGYYIAIAVNGEMILVIGDLRKEAHKKTRAIISPSLDTANLISKRENICGKRIYQTKSQFIENGPVHDLKIEYGDDVSLVVEIDGKIAMQVKQLKWKFRGNCMILIDGAPVEVYWDVYNWLFRSRLGNAVFVFRSSLLLEKTWTGLLSPCDSNVGPWSCLGNLKEDGFSVLGSGFSLILYAMMNER